MILKIPKDDFTTFGDITTTIQWNPYQTMDYTIAETSGTVNFFPSQVNGTIVNFPTNTDGVDGS